MIINKSKQRFKQLVLTTLICISLVFTTSCNFKATNNDFNEVLCSTQTLTQNQARSLFLASWKAVKDQYVDKSLNHQDWNRWKAKYENKIKTMNDAYVAIDTMVESLNDPYTVFLNPKEFKEQSQSIDAKLYGIGVNIAKLKEETVIVDIIEGTPAEKSGLKIGDIILKVNNVPVKGYSLAKVADLVRGRAGTKVSLTIVRNKQKIVKNVPRKEISLKSVSYKVLNNNVAYIKLSNFISQDAAVETANALNKTQNSRGIILDLRGNHGGLLPNAVIISDMFLNKGKIVSIVDRNGNRDSFFAGSVNKEIYVKKPLVILIDKGSASASEILCGALKDHKRAVLVGDRTFGKGLVQKIQPLPQNSGMNITIAKYLTPNGYDINKKGIQPDYKVEMTQKDFLNHKDPQLEKAKEVLNSKIRKDRNS